MILFYICLELIITLKVWGGYRMFTKGKTPQILEAIRTFTEDYPDPKAGIIATAELTIGSLAEIWIIFMFYDGPKPPANAFAAFNGIKATLDITKTRTMDDLVKANNLFVLKNQFYTIATESTTLPNSTYSPQVMKGFYDAWRAVAITTKSIPGVVASIAFQPLPRSFIQRSQERGGIVTDFDDSVDRVIFELDYSHWHAKDSPAIHEATTKTYTALGQKVKQYQDVNMLPQAHLPLFLNDAYMSQDYWGRLKPENAARYRTTRAKYDPENILSGRTKGFHL